MKFITRLSLIAILAVTLSGCMQRTCVVGNFQPGRGCEWTGPYCGPSGCGPYYSADGQTSRDLLTGLDMYDEAEMEARAARISARYLLTDEQGLRLSRSVRDFTLLENRSDADLADFSLRLYGVSPAAIIAAAAEAQLGNAQELQRLIAQAAEHFGTDPATMREIVGDLHSGLLFYAGIEL